MVLFVIGGGDCSRAYYKDLKIESNGYVVNAIETTGAGDTFCGSSLSGVLEYGFNDLTEKDLKSMLRFANAAAALITTRKGTIRSMPEKSEVENYLNGN